MLGLDRPITGENNRSLDDVLELAKVPWPGISLEEVQGVSRDPLHLLVDLRFRFAKEVIGQDRQVLHPFAKPRKGDRERIEPIEEVLSEFRALHRGLQIPVRRDGASICGWPEPLTPSRFRTRRALKRSSAPARPAPPARQSLASWGSGR